MLGAGIKDFAGALFDVEANCDILLGFSSDARRKASQALELSKDPDVRSYAAAVFAQAGDLTRSATILTGSAARVPR